MTHNGVFILHMNLLKTCYLKKVPIIAPNPGETYQLHFQNVMSTLVFEKVCYANDIPMAV